MAGDFAVTKKKPPEGGFVKIPEGTSLELENLRA